MFAEKSGKILKNIITKTEIKIITQQSESLAKKLTQLWH